METDKVDKFLLANEYKFPEYEIPIHRLLELSPEKELLLHKTNFVSPGLILFISVLFGITGLDRFLIGDWGKGLGKLFTAGGFTIWYMIDWFLITGATKKKNMKKMENIINMK